MLPNTQWAKEKEGKQKWKQHTLKLVEAAKAVL